MSIEVSFDKADKIGEGSFGNLYRGKKMGRKSTRLPLGSRRGSL